MPGAGVAPSGVPGGMPGRTPRKDRTEPTTPAAEGVLQRTEFVILFVWKEPTPSGFAARFENHSRRRRAGIAHSEQNPHRWGFLPVTILGLDGPRKKTKKDDKKKDKKDAKKEDKKDDRKGK